MTDSSKEPSKGAEKAAELIALDHPDATDRNLGGMIAEMAKIIDRETKAPQMADLLRELCKSISDDSRMMTNRQHDALVRAERLLTDLEVKP